MQFQYTCILNVDGLLWFDVLVIEDLFVNWNRFVAIYFWNHTPNGIYIKRNVGYAGRMNQIINFRRNRPMHLMHCKERSINIAFHEM